eukprot:1861441-Rhodomonas_salina.6
MSDQSTPIYKNSEYDTNSNRAMNKSRIAAFVNLGLHFVVTTALVVLMFLKDPKIWHRSFTVSQAPSKHGGGNYIQHIDLGDKTASSYLSSSCIEKNALNSSIWLTPNHDNIYDLEYRICKFSHVSNTWSTEADPRGLHVLSSGTPVFMLVSVQIVIFANLIWSSGFFKWSFSYNRPWIMNPLDMIIAWVVMIGWFCMSFFIQKSHLIVYNNIMLVGMLVLTTTVSQMVWSWRKYHADSYVVPQVMVDDTLSNDYPSSASSDYENTSNSEGFVAHIDPKLQYFSGKNKTLFATERNETVVRFKMAHMIQPTNVPMLSITQEGDKYNGTFHTLDDVWDTLWVNHILAVPRISMFMGLIPVVAVAGMYTMGSVWTFAEIFYTGLILFLLLAVMVPAYAMMRITVMASVSGKNNDSTKDVTHTLFITVVHCMLTSFVFLAFAAMYMLFNVLDVMAAQPESDTMPCYIAFAGCIMYPFVIWGCILVSLFFSRTDSSLEQLDEKFTTITWVIEAMTTVFSLAVAGTLAMLMFF